MAEPLWGDEHYKVLLDALEEGVVLQDRNGQVLIANPAAERIFGLPPDGFAGGSALDERWRVAFADGTPAAWDERPAAVVLRTGQASDHVILRIGRPDGNELWLSVNARPVFADADGLPTGAVVSFVDVTATHQAQAEAAATARRLETFLAYMTDLVSVINADGSMQYVSPVTQQMLGRSGEMEEEESLFHHVHPDDIGRAVEQYTKLASQPGTHAPFTARIRHEDGSYRMLEVSASNLLDDPAVQGIIVCSRDVTDRLLTQASLQEAEQRFEQVFERAGVGMNIVSLDGSFLRVNPAYCRLVGYTPDQLAGMSIFEISDPDAVERTRAQYDDLIAGNINEYQMDKQLRRADGVWIWARITASIVRDAAETALYSIGLVTDITDTRELADRLEHAATHDHLTGLAARSVLHDHLERSLALARRTNEPVAVLVVDLDGFKAVNDTRGHAAGDAVLVESARRLESLVRATDLVVRLGGDEFVLVLAPSSDPDGAVEIAQRIVDALAAPFSVAGAEIRIGASVGLAYSLGVESADALLADADRALYRAKERGRGTLAVSAPETPG